MTTVAERTEQLLEEVANRAGHSSPAYRVEEVMVAGDGDMAENSTRVRVFVFHHPEAGLTYASTTHWRTGFVTIDRRGSTGWSSGGTCDDVTELEIATVMSLVWEDVRQRQSEQDS